MIIVRRMETCWTAEFTGQNAPVDTDSITVETSFPADTSTREVIDHYERTFPGAVVVQEVKLFG
jgi:hypothetical protein